MKDKIQNNVVLLFMAVAAFVMIPVFVRLKNGVVNGGQSVVNFAADSLVKAKYKPDGSTWGAIRDIVQGVYDAYHASGVDEDENKAVSNLKGLKTAYQVQLASALYKARYGASLKVESEKYLTDGMDFLGIDLKRVPSVVKNNWF